MKLTYKQRVAKAVEDVDRCLPIAEAALVWNVTERAINNSIKWSLSK